MDSAKKIFTNLFFNLKIFFIQLFKYLFSKRFIFSHYFIMTLIFLLTLSSIYLFYSRFRVAEAGDAWFNDLWKKRQKVLVTNSSNTQFTNFIAEASFDGSTLISSGSLNSNCSDIRVTDSELNVLNHWVDPQTCNTSEMKVYFKVPILYSVNEKLSGINTFYVYYGNSDASLATVPQTSLFVATIPNLRANYNFELVSGNSVPDKSGLGNNGRLVNSVSTPTGGTIENISTFPEGNRGNAYFFNGYNVVVSTPIRMIDLTNAYTLLTFIKPEGTRANAYPTKYPNYVLKKFNFENIDKGATCATSEYQDGDGVAACSSDGYTYTPGTSTQKKLGSYGYFLDHFGNYLGTNASLSVTFNGTTQYLFANTPVNFTPWFPYYYEYGYYYKVRLNGSPGDVRTIHSFGNTSAASGISYSFDYAVCSDGSLQFILDYRNSTDSSKTLATPCLNSVSPSTKISSNGGKYPIYANASKWLDVATAHFQGKRYIFVNGVEVASDLAEAAPTTLDRQNSKSFIGKPSNITKSYLKGEIDDFFAFGNDSTYFNSIYFSGNVFNATVEQVINNINKRSYLIFGGGQGENWTKAGFSNQAFGAYPSADAISDFNYNFNTTNNNDTFEQYSVYNNPVGNITSSKLPTSLNLFSGDWYRYYTDFDDKRNSIISSYQLGANSTTFTRTYNSTNPNGVLYIGGYFNSNDVNGVSSRPTEFFFGGMDDVFIYSATLSATQLTYHSSPWNSYVSYGKTLWQADLPSAARGTITISQNFGEEGRKEVWYDKNYPFRIQVNVFSLPVLTIPNFQVTFTLDTSTPISNMRMNSDCSGIIVVDDFNRQIPYWIEGCNGRSSRFHVRLNPDNSINTNATYSIKGGKDQKLFVYYGNEKSTAKTYPVNQVFDYTIPGLEIAYTFEDDTATVSYDKSGNGRNLTKSNVTTTSSGAYGIAPLFNGSSGYGSLANPDATIRSSWSGITHLFWMKVQGLDISFNRNPIVQQYPGTDNRYLNYAAIGSGGFAMRTQIYGPTDLLEISGTNVNDFNFFGVSWKFGSGNTVNSFYNTTKTSISTTTNYEIFPNTGDGLFIGAFCCNPGLSNYWTGAIDEVRVFSRQLSDIEMGYYTYNTTIGTSRFATSENTCNQINNFCMRSFVTPSFPDTDLLGKYNSNVVITTNAETRINTPYIYFKFNEGKGLRVGDSSNRIGSSSLGDIRFSNILTGNEPAWSPEEKCIEGECLYFDGLNDYVDVQTIPGGKADTNLTFNSDYSYSFWVKPLSNPNARQTLISFGESTTGLEGYTVYLDGGMRLYNYGTRAGTLINSSASTLPINKWSHISLVFDNDSNTSYFYVNGSLDSTYNYTATCSLAGTCAGNNLNLIHLGANAAGTGYQDDYFRGYMDEFKIYKAQLNSDDVLDDYRKGLGSLRYNLSVDQDTVTNFNLMAYYPFDEMDRNVGFDYSGNNSEGRYPDNAFNNSPGIFNNAFSNPGQSATSVTFSIPNSIYVNLNSKIALSIWFKRQPQVSDNSGSIVYKAGTGGYSINVDSTTNKYTANICGTDLSSGAGYTSNVWDHLVLTSDSTKAKLFVNSVLVDEEYCFNSYVGLESNTNPILVGGLISGFSSAIVNGLFDEFRIYDNYLTNKQVQLLFSYKPVYSEYGANATAFYKLDASDGTTTAVDASGNNNTLNMIVPATNQNAWSTYGKIGNSYDFFTRAAGTLNLFSQSTSTFTTGLTRPHTLMTWVAFSEPSYGKYVMGLEPNAISLGDQSTGNLYSALAFKTSASNVLFPSFFQFRTQAQMIDFSSPYLYTSIPPKTPIWYHVAATFDGNLRKLYINGELVNVDTGVTKTWSISTSRISLGSPGGNYTNTQYQFMGLLDETKIYSYARTQDQIKMDMRNSGTSPALNSTFYSTIRSNQKPSSLNTSGDSTIYPLVDLGFDSYFETSSTLVSNSPVTLDEITFNSLPENVPNFQIQFSIPLTSYLAKNFSHPSCSNFILTDEKGRRIQYWAEPDSCRAGTGYLVAKFPYTTKSLYLKVMMDPYKTSSNVFRNYSNNVEDIFDFTVPDLVLAHNFEETTGDISYDSSGFGNNIQWASRNNISTGAFGRAPFLDGTNHYGSMPFFTTNIRNKWTGFSLFGWIWAASTTKTMQVIDFPRIDNSNYFSYGRFYDGAGGNYQFIRAYATANHITANNGGVEYLFRGFTSEFAGSATNWLTMFDDGASVFNVSTGRVGNSFPNTNNLACIGRIGGLTGLCTTNSEGWLGSFDELRGFSRKLSLPEYQAYMKNSTNDYVPLGNSGVIGSGVADPENTCNLAQGWCTKSFVTPSFPGTDLLGKYNSKVFPVYSKVDQPVFSFANRGAVFADGEGVRGGSAYFFTSGTEINMSLSSNRFNFAQGSDAAISFYIKTTEVGVGSIASSTGLKINKRSDNTVQFSGAKFDLISTRTLPANSWAHVFFQKNGQTGVFELLIDNELQSASYSSTNELDLSDLKFSVNASAPYYLDELKIYNTVLTPALIFNLYNTGGFGIKMGSEDSSICVTGSTNNCIKPTDSYLFNEISGQTAFNTIRGRSNLSLGQGTSRASGYIGKGLQFRGFDNETFATNLINASGQGSFSFWYKSDIQGKIFSGKGISITPYPGNLFFGSTNLSTVYSGSLWGDFYGYTSKDSWHHINVNYDTSVTPATLRFYLDGVDLLNTTYTKDTSDENWMKTSGNIDNLNFYNYQRDDSQVAQEYARGKPFAHFKFEECSGTKFYNSNSNLYKPLQYRESGSRTDAQAFLNTGLNLTRATNALNFYTNLCQTGKYNKSFYFDGDLYLEGNDYHSRVFNSEGNATITFWINLDSNATQNVNLIGSYDGTNAHLIKLINRDISVYLNKNASTTLKVTGTTDLPLADWAHVAIVFENATNYKIYINGQLDATGSGNFESVLNTCTGGSPVVCTNRPFIVGSGFKGKLDDLKIYNYPLTQKQIKIDMNQNSAIRVE